MHRKSNTMMLLVLIYAALSMEALTQTEPCHAANHEYFHEQFGGCLPCEKCNPGEEQMNIDEWASSIPSKIFTKYGPTQCPVCVTCRVGFFNDGRAFECKRCQNCTLHNKHEVEPCTSHSNSVCDGVLTNESVDAKHVVSTTATNNGIHPGSVIAITFLLVGILSLGLTMVGIRYRRSKKKHKNTVIDTEDGSTIPLMPISRPSQIRRTRRNSEPSSYSSEGKTRHFQRYFSDPGDGYSLDLEKDGVGTSVSFDKKMDKDCLVSLSKHLCEKSLCFPFARKLGLSDANIDTIKHDYDRDGLGEVSYQILAELQKCGKLVYKKDAIDALREMGLTHIIEKIR